MDGRVLGIDDALEISVLIEMAKRYIEDMEQEYGDDLMAPVMVHKALGALLLYVIASSGDKDAIMAALAAIIETAWRLALSGRFAE